MSVLCFYLLCTSKCEANVLPNIPRADVNNIKELAMPAFPLDLVREIVMSGLEEAVRVNQVHNRDPIGGSNEDLFV